MSISGPGGTGARRGDDSGDAEYARLRELLIGPERTQLAELETRLRDFSLRASDVGDVLPEAVLLRAGRDPALRQALQPVLVESLRSSIRKDPFLLADTMFPIIGAAVRKAVAVALQDMTDSLNQVVESSVSVRALGWRLEAARTGKPYAEIALLRSLLYKVEQVFLIHRGTGLLLGHVTAAPAEARDPALISAMLSAIQDFVHDSFGGQGQTLEMVRVGGLSVWIQHGPQALLAGVVRGTAPPALRHVFASRIETVHRDFASELAGFDGDQAPFEGSRTILEDCLLGQGSVDAKRSFAPLYAIAVLLLLLAGGWAAFEYTQRSRWNRYLSLVSAEPGIVITRQSRTGGRFAISGLRDPLAADPARLYAAARLAEDRVEARWEPFLSLAPRFVAERELRRIQTEVERHIVHFELGKSSLTAVEAARLADLAARIAEYARVAQSVEKTAELTVEGHADAVGTAEINQRLAGERSEAVKKELIRLGVAGESITRKNSGLETATERTATFRIAVRGR